MTTNISIFLFRNSNSKGKNKTSKTLMRAFAISWVNSGAKKIGFLFHNWEMAKIHKDVDLIMQNLINCFGNFYIWFFAEACLIRAVRMKRGIPTWLLISIFHFFCVFFLFFFFLYFPLCVYIL